VRTQRHRRRRGSLTRGRSAPPSSALLQGHRPVPPRGHLPNRCLPASHTDNRSTCVAHPDLGPPSRQPEPREPFNYWADRSPAELEPILTVGHWAFITLALAYALPRLVIALVVLLKVPADKLPGVLRALAELFRAWR
jgi:hypothetical protein